MAAKFAKTEARYWRSKLFKRTNDFYHVQIGYAGVQERWPLNTANAEEAAAKARNIFISLRTVGRDETRKKFKTWTAEPEQAPAPVTVGEYIMAARTVAGVRPTTFTTYERKLRFLVSQIAGVKGNRSKFDYVHGGANRFRGQVDNVPLDKLTADKIAQWRVRYISQNDKNPLKRRAAQTTAQSIIRNAKSLFAKSIVSSLPKTMLLPLPLPFDGVTLDKPVRNRYQSKIEPAALVSAAHAELKQGEPEQFKIFLLAFGAGLRRGEIDRLTWKQFNWRDQRLSIETNEYGDNKTESSNEEIDLGDDLLAYFRVAKEQSQSEFVVESKAAPTAAPHWNRYRCDGHFKAMLTWLRSQGVTARNPLHTLRKEFGSLINQKFGIFAASAALRHSNVKTTRDSYLDKKERTALNLSELISQTTTESKATP